MVVVIIGAYVEHAAPEHPAGAEWGIQDAFSWLAKRGHDCRVVARRGARRERLGGVLVYSSPSEEETARHFQEVDVMLTQLDATVEAQLLAASYQTPLVQMIHSAGQLGDLGVMDSCSALVVFNSQHVADACAWWPGQSMLLHPPIDAERVRVDQPGACITLVNLSHNKGGATLVRLAELMESRPFLGIQGAYGEQALGAEGFPGTKEHPTPTGLPANLKVYAPTERIADTFAFTRVLLVLSRDESYGRIAGEAILSGIPVVATRTPGLSECLGVAGVYVDDRDDHHALRATIERVYATEWDERSAAVLDHSQTTQATSALQLRDFERALQVIALRQPEMTL